MQVASIRNVWARTDNVKLRGAEAISPGQQGLRDLAVLKAWRDLGNKDIAAQKRCEAFGHF